jgi:hypothetical protein
MEEIKELAETFEGRGEVRGDTFNIICKNERAYLYQRCGDIICFEVFKRKVNKQFNCVSYPKSNSFGDWAWCFTNLYDAMNKFNTL